MLVPPYISHAECLAVFVQKPAACNSYTVWRDSRPRCDVEFCAGAPQHVEARHKFEFESNCAADRERSKRKRQKCFNS